MCARALEQCAGVRALCEGVIHTHGATHGAPPHLLLPSARAPCVRVRHKRGCLPHTLPPLPSSCADFGTSTDWGRGAGSGPWVMADLENGLWAGNEKVNPANKPSTTIFVTAMVKGGSNGFALKAGDAMQGVLTTMFDGPRPNGYQPMKKQGSIILGIGGDNSDSAIGSFYEGVMTSGYSTDAADDAVQVDIVAAGYGQ